VGDLKKLLILISYNNCYSLFTSKWCAKNHFKVYTQFVKNYLKKFLSFCRSPSAGKLINYVVEDLGHVFAGDVYAEIEVMKMVMELRVTESGWWVESAVLIWDEVNETSIVVVLCSVSEL